MRRVQEAYLRDPPSQKLDKFFDDLFSEALQCVNESYQWPTTSQTSGVTVRQKPRQNDHDHKILQRSSVHSEVTYDQLRELLFVNHSLNETKYVELMVEAKELFALSSQHNNKNTPKQAAGGGAGTGGAAGVYWLGFKATLASSREFIELVATREQKDETNGLREFFVVSKPVEPTNLRPVRNYVRGCYEAWERVRELQDGEVEWTCIQRSDPGGWVPRCLSDWIIAKEFHKDVGSIIHYIAENNTKKSSHMNDSATKVH
ncbi:hypothetical protein BDB00DRAFT_799094 [Zychaea mexicana]|uniref:uncharacterized protein n=1 Tax=Zychaea mexicana TaxID=64656 RepID=UPI0022FE5577|nr:uncharacterized protein BDB00DRAFT_799094 [Zychaea mexicana]KAI9498679.1 hypothetical protein BDB00DRAFT_799094 [Zychaea mexicana]